MKLDPIGLDREYVRRFGLYGFLRLAWSHVEPRAFVDNWHYPLLCSVYESVSRGEIPTPELVVNIPPGMGKSLVSNVFWPAWDAIENPGAAWLFGSFDEKIVHRDARRYADLLRSRWYIERWGERLPGAASPNVSDMRTAQGGHRFSTTPRGKGTGHHFDRQVIDDPIKPLDAMGGPNLSTNALDLVREWRLYTLTSRWRDIARRCQVWIGQALAEGDPTQELREEGATAVVIPMRYEMATSCVLSLGGKLIQDPRTEEGELLFPSRFPEESVRKLENDLGDQADAQLQQRPGKKSGNTVESDWIEEAYWSHDPKLTDRRLPDRGGFFLISADLTFKDERGNDFVAMGCAYVVGEDVYFVELLNRRIDFLESCDEMQRLAAKWPEAWWKLVEDKANGPALMSALRKKVSGLVPVEPQGGKGPRLRACAGSFRARKVHFQHPEEETWTLEAKKQITRFPFVKHDDLMDMVTQLLNKIRQHGSSDFDAAMQRVLRGGRG